MGINNQDEYEKKNEISFLTQIFLFFACSMGLYFYYSGFIPGDQGILFILILLVGYSYAIISTGFKIRSRGFFFNLRSQLSTSYFIFISLLFSMVLTTILGLSGYLPLLPLSWAVSALQLFFVYRLLMFYDKRLRYLSDQYKQRIEDKIKIEMDQFIK